LAPPQFLAKSGLCSWQKNVEKGVFFSAFRQKKGANNGRLSTAGHAGFQLSKGGWWLGILSSFGDGSGVTRRAH
jgi:hypothetical protein